MDENAENNVTSPVAAFELETQPPAKTPWYKRKRFMIPIALVVVSQIWAQTPAGREAMAKSESERVAREQAASAKAASTPPPTTTATTSSVPAAPVKATTPAPTPTSSTTSTSLIGVYIDDCGVAKNVLADGRSVSLNTGKGKNTITQVACVLNALDAPSGLAAQIDATRALDGMQSQEWGGGMFDVHKKQAKWTYHPDAGLTIVVSLV